MSNKDKPDLEDNSIFKDKSNTLANLVRVFGPFLGLLFIIALFSIIDYIQASRGGWEPSYFTASNFVNVSNQTVIVALAALGMTMVIISAGIDLSVGSIIALVTVVIAIVMRCGIGENGLLSKQYILFLPFLAALAGIGTGAAAGFVNGVLITRLKVVSFIITLGMMGIARGFAKMFSGQQKIDAPAGWLKGVMETPSDSTWLSMFGDLSWGVWIMIAFGVLTALIMRYTVFGRYVFGIGSNESTARLCGINVERTQVLIYTLSGACAGIAGVMMFSILTVGDPSVAIGKELDVIAAVIIGGGSFNGGEGSILGTIIGAYIMSFLRSGCDAIGLPNYWTEIFIGSIIILAVAIDQLRHKKKN